MYINKIKNTIFTFMLILMSVGLNVVSAITQSQIDNYRVRIHSTTSNTVIRATNGYVIQIDGKDVNYAIKSSGEEFTLSKTSNGVSIKSGSKSIGEGLIVTFKKINDKTKYIEVKGLNGLTYAQYPDNLTIRLDSGKSQMLVINETNLETYLKGVVPHEIGASAPLEALKAQAITARTVAVNRVNKYDKDGYDVTSTTSDQVYKGYNATYFSTTHNVTKAVEATKGLVLSYNGKLVEGLFYSNNGGQTANDGFVWGSGISTPYYKSKVDSYDTYLHKSTASWGKINYSGTYTKEELRKIILDGQSRYPGYYKSPYCVPNFNGLSENYNIEVMSETNGYITQIRLSDDEGRVYILKNYAVRWIFGQRSQQYKITRIGGLFVKSPSKINEKDSIYVKSADGTIKEVKKSNVTLKSASKTSGVENIKYHFNGAGYGHGIGMSQNGAMNRAEAGHTYKQILDFYYEGTTISKNYNN